MMNSSRTFPGRLFSCVTSARKGPWLNLAVVRTVLMDLSFSTPPCAWIFLAMTSSTVCARAIHANENAVISTGTKTFTILENSLDCDQCKFHIQLTPSNLRARIVHQFMRLTLITVGTGHQLDEPNPQMEAGKAGHLQSPSLRS